MKNYKELIRKELGKIDSEFEIFDDVNGYINKIIKNKELNWYPSFLAKANQTLFLFMPFDSEPYLDDDEIQIEIDSASELVRHLNDENINSIIMFITEQVEDSNKLYSLNLDEWVGILHIETEKPVLEMSANHKQISSYHLLPNVIEYLSECKNLKGPIGKLIKNFSKEYLKLQDRSDEESIRHFIEDLLKSDKRFELGSDVIKTMANIERLLVDSGRKLRDHYFHACNTMLIGFMIIDKFYDKFEELCQFYGDDIVIEYIWLITAIYHDVGYPGKLFPAITAQVYLMDETDDVIGSIEKQTRQQLWNEKYPFAALILKDLYQHIINGEYGEKWIFDGFPRSQRETKFLKGLQLSFIEYGAHGSTGVLILITLLSKIIQQIENNEERQYLYRHIAIASISILFHDYQVRSVYREISIKKVKASLFPLSLLLTYIDILQDDRRDLSGSSTKPDIFNGIDDNDKEIKAKLDIKSLNNSTRKKIFDELSEALEFFIMNGIKVSIPNELYS